jgi:hypothetical protein
MYQARETPNLPINYFKYPLVDSSNSIDDGEANACGYCQADFKVTVQVAHLGCGHIYHAHCLSHIADEVNPLSPDHPVCPTCQAPFKRSEMKFLRKTGAAMARERAEKQGNRMAAVDPSKVQGFLVPFHFNFDKDPPRRTNTLYAYDHGADASNLIMVQVKCMREPRKIYIWMDETEDFQAAGNHWQVMRFGQDNWHFEIFEEAPFFQIRSDPIHWHQKPRDVSVTHGSTIENEDEI